MPVLDPNHPEWKGFVASMRESPVDDTVRLAFADFVEEQGGPAFAGLIRSMVEIARTDPTNLLGVTHWDERVLPGQTRWNLYADAERYLKSAWAVWSPLNKLHPDAKELWRFHRGFPDKVVLNWRGLKFLDTLCAIGPVGEVEVVSGSPVEATVFDHSIQWSVRSDPAFAARCHAIDFVEPTVVQHPAPYRRSIWFAQATNYFLQQVWGDKVHHIRYNERPSVQVWPKVPGQGVLLPHQDPFITTQAHHTEE